MTEALEENARTHGKKRSNKGKEGGDEGAAQGEGQGDQAGNAPKRSKTGSSSGTLAGQPDGSLTATDSKLCKILRLQGTASKNQQILTRLCGSPEARVRLFSANKSEPPTKRGVRAYLSGHPSASVPLSQNELDSGLESDESSGDSEDMTDSDESDEWESGGHEMESRGGEEGGGEGDGE